MTESTVRVTAYTGGRKVPSARFRVRQYIPELRRYGVLTREICSMAGAYPPASAVARPFWGIANIGEHLVSTAASYYRSDVTLLQREFLSTFCTLERMLKRPMVLDVDDAIWTYRSGGFARRLARLADGVICGNEYLAGWFARWNDRVAVIPTPVDTDHFRPASKEGRGDGITILWLGGSGNLPYLYDIEDALSAVLGRHPAAILRVVTDGAPRFERVPAGRFEFLEWNEEDEIRFIQESDIGVMPLRDGEWERGKCSFKMLAYMACGLPVVASRVGMNVEVLERGRVGFGADTRDEWVGAIESLAADRDLRGAMGREGRQAVEEHYSVRANAKRLAGAIRSVAGEDAGGRP